MKREAHTWIKSDHNQFLSFFFIVFFLILFQEFHVTKVTDSNHELHIVIFTNRDLILASLPVSQV